MLTPFTLFAFITLRTQFREVNKINLIDRIHFRQFCKAACDGFCVDAAHFLLSRNSMAYYYHNNI